MDTNKMREQFEVAAKEQGLSLARTSQELRFANGHSRTIGDYIALETLCAWWAWQASREAVVVDLPATGTLLAPGWNQAIHLCRECIEAQGMKVKL